MTAHGVTESSFFTINQSLINLILKDSITIDKFSTAFYTAKNSIQLDAVNNLDSMDPSVNNSPTETTQAEEDDGLMRDNLFGYHFIIPITSNHTYHCVFLCL